jgi:RNA polymerase sigma-70 factor (ECF subfamily)
MNNAKNTETDQAIVARVRGGDSDAYALLIGRYEQKLLRYVAFQTRDYDLAADIVQESFIKAYVNLWSYRETYSFSAWIYRIAHNQMVSTLRSIRHSVPDADTVLDKIAYDPELAEAIDIAALQANVQNCLQGLEYKYRAVLQLVYFERMTYSDAADVLHIPPSTVGVWVLRAKAKLRAICEQKGTTHA